MWKDQFSKVKIQVSSTMCLRKNAVIVNHQEASMEARKFGSTYQEGHFTSLQEIGIPASSATNTSAALQRPFCGV